MPLPLRDLLRNNPQVITAITLALIGVVLVMMGYQLLTDSPASPPSRQPTTSQGPHLNSN